MPLISQLKLKSRVLHISHVGKRLSLTYITRDRHLDNHSVGLLDEVVNGECQCIVEEAEVKTDVCLLTLLPLEVGIGKAVGLRAIYHRGSLAEIVVACAAHCRKCGVSEISDIVITVLTPREAHLEIGKP